MDHIQNPQQWFLRLKNGKILPRSGRFLPWKTSRASCEYEFDPDATCPIWRAYLGQFENLNQKSLQRFFRNCAVPQRRKSKLLVVITQPGRPTFEIGFTPAEYILTGLIKSMFSNLSSNGLGVYTAFDSSKLESKTNRPVAIMRNMPHKARSARILAETIYRLPIRMILFTRRDPIDWKMPMHRVADFRTDSNVFHVELRELIEERSGILNWALETLRDKNRSQPDHWLPKH